MNKRVFIQKIVGVCLISVFLVIGFVGAQESKESKLRRTGSTGSIKLVDLRAVVRNGLLTVQASMLNDSSFTSPINYRFKWRDGDGMTIGDEENWKPINMFPGQTVDIIGVALNPQASDFIIELNGSN